MSVFLPASKREGREKNEGVCRAGVSNCAGALWGFTLCLGCFLSRDPEP